MAQDKITEIFDIQAIEANIAKAISAAKAALPELQKLGENIKANTTIGGASNNTAAANAAMAQFTQNLKEYTEAVKAAAAARINLSKVSDEEAAKQKVNSTALNAQLKEEIKLTSNLTGAYEKLNIQHKQAIKAYQDAAAAGKLSAQQLVVLKDNANKLGEQLVKIDAGVGNFRRNVGNYSSAWNGLGMSIQQVARELPNFAQSMQLGFLAISNNLPILADELKRAKDNIALLKKEGKDAPSLFSQIAASVFSWQTLLTIGITLLVKYGAEIADLVSNVSDAEKMMRKYQEALKDSVKAESEGISKLYALKSALADTTNSRETDLQIFNDVKKEYPEYFDYLTTEKGKLSEINTVIDNQIKSRVQNAKQIALNKVAADATNEYVKAQLDLNKAVTVWDKFLSTGSKNTSNFTESTKASADAYKLLYKEGKITNNELLVYLDRLKVISNAEKQMTISTENLTNAIQNQSVVLNSSYDNNIKKLQTQVLLAKSGSKEELKAKENLIRSKLKFDEEELLQKYKNQQTNLEYIIEFNYLQAQAQKEIELLYKKGSENRRATDVSDFDAKKRLIKAEADLDRERFEQSIATNKAIADNQNNYFTLRIQSEDDIATKQYEQAKRTYEEKISLLENEEKAIEKIRAKGAKTEAERQKVSKNNTDAILAEKKLAEEEFVKTTLYIQDENQKQITKIYEQEVNKRLAIINGQLDAIQISGDNEKRVALEALKERFMAGEMKIKEYRAKAQTLEEEYDNKTLESKKKVIEKELYNFTQSEEVRTELKGKYNRLNETIEKNEFDSFVRTEDEKQKLREQIAQKQVELATEVANIIATINRAQNEQEIRDFEKKKELLQKDSELELYAIEQSSIAESEKANLKKVLAAETAAKEQEIANQIAEIKRKQAIADKAQALFSIALNTAIAVSQINASPAVNADPTQILRATLTKLVIGLGAVQAGIVLATPLPQYAKGKKASDGYEGLAIAGEKGTEMKIDKDGSLQLLTKPTLIHTKRGDTILSNRELMSGELGKHIKTDKQKANYDELIKAYSYHTDRTIKAIKNSPSNIIIDNSNYNLSLKRARV
jgi:hypothetical protein